MFRISILPSLHILAICYKILAQYGKQLMLAIAMQELRMILDEARQLLTGRPALRMFAIFQFCVDTPDMRSSTRLIKETIPISARCVRRHDWTLYSFLEDYWLEEEVDVGRMRLSGYTTSVYDESLTATKSACVNMVYPFSQYTYTNFMGRVVLRGAKNRLYSNHDHLGTPCLCRTSL